MRMIPCCGKSRLIKFKIARMSNKLKLDQQQQNQLMKIQASISDLHDELIETSNNARHAFVDLLESNHHDHDRLVNMILSPSFAYADSLPDMVAQFSEFYSSLSDWQRKHVLIHADRVFFRLAIFH